MKWMILIIYKLTMYIYAHTQNADKISNEEVITYLKTMELWGLQRWNKASTMVKHKSDMTWIIFRFAVSYFLM